MNLLSPLGLLWLGSIPLLLWLWRLASTRRRIRVPSLVPFEHLLRRTSRRRTRLVINALFWLQLAALILLALALTGPALLQRRAHTILVVMDTSASMGAQRPDGTVFEHARRKLLSRLSRKAAADPVFIVSSAPVAALMEQPTHEMAEIRQRLSELRVSHLAGDLATATRIGRALLGGVVDQTLVVSDETPPSGLSADVEFLTVGEALPNLAIVGFDALGGFCAEDSSRLIATVQNFSAERAGVRVAAKQRARAVAEASVTLAAGERVNVSLAIPEDTQGWVDVFIEADPDALVVDNHVQVLLRRPATFPVAVLSEEASFRGVVGKWLDACQSLVWTDGIPPSPSSDFVVVTDGAGPSGPHVAGTLRWVTQKPRRAARLAHWMVDADHPIGSYLGPVEVVAASLDAGRSLAFPGNPVVWTLFEGEKAPLVLAGEHDGRRTVSVLVDPVESPDSIPLVMLFFNSLRWLMGQPDVVRTGELISAASLKRGPVAVRRPDGTVERLHHDGGLFQYDATAHVGSYSIVQGSTTVHWVANFVDPLESNLMERRSTWQRIPEGRPASSEQPRTRRPLAKTFALVILALLLLEWWLYSRKRA